MKQMARWGVLPLLAAPVGTWALGLGDIQLQSALDQPLRAQIRLSATKDELEGLDVSLADQATFQRYGLDRPAFLSTLKFDVTKDGAGHDIIRVTSPEPINEPFVTMLLQATWPKGRSLREYTVLLDPPVFGTDKSAPVRQAQSQPAQSASPASGAIARPSAAQARRASPAPAAAAAAQSQAQAQPSSSAPAAARSASLGGSYGPVQRAETLWSIAAQVKPAGATMNQTMVALYDSNPQAFEGNMNLLRRGATLKIPLRADIGNVTASSATAEVRRQTDQWRTRGSAQQAAAAGQSSGQRQARLRLEPPSADSGNAASAEAAAGAAGAAGTAESNAAGGGSGGSASAGNAQAGQLQNQVDQLQTQLEESQRLLQVRNQQLRDLQQQLSAAKSGNTAAAASAADSAQSSAGVQLDSGQVFAEGQQNGAQQSNAQAGNAAAGGGNAEAQGGQQPAQSAANPPAAQTQPPAQAQSAPQTQPQPASAAPAAAGPPAAGQKVVSTTSASPSLLSRVIGALARPMVLIGIGVGALLLTALWYLRRRREEVEDVTGRWEALEAEAEADHIDLETTERLRRQAQDNDFIVEESQSAPQRKPEAPPAEPRPAAAEAPDSSATGKFEAPSGVSDETLSSQTVINLDQADPVAEADFHMAYGLYDQAAELVSQAIEKDPSNRGLKLKLLEVFFVWGNKEAFLDAAKAFRSETGEGADSDWDKVIIMGKQICPDDPLFADATAGAAEVDVDLDAGDGQSQALDFAFDESSSGAAVADAGVDLDLGSGGEDSIDLQLEGTGDRESQLGANDESAFGSSDDDSLDIGEATSAGLEEALFGLDDDDTGRRTTPNVDADALAETQESPTVESPQGGFGDSAFSSLTIESPTEESPAVAQEAASDESPTVESSAIRDDGGDAPAFGIDEDEDASSEYSADAPTVETPTVESSAIRSGDADAPTVETPTVETAYSAGDEATVETAFGGRSEPAASESAGSDSPTELTAEIDLDDLGLDVKDLESLPEDIGELPSAEQAETDTREQPALDTDDELLSATGVTQVLGETDMDMEYANTSVLGNDDATMLAQGPGDETLSGTEVLEQSAEPAEQTGMHDASGLDVDLDDFDAALGGGDTVEQPRVQAFATDVFGGGNGQTPVDLDIGSDVAGSDDPTGTEDIGALDPQTMTEVGTKLDLARAYIDMGDPEGARSILEEVLDEGDAGQKREAQSLIEVLTA
jgi:pilus assembly protein FimV